jgi:hypothetical protein
MIEKKSFDNTTGCFIDTEGFREEKAGFIGVIRGPFFSNVV